MIATDKEGNTRKADRLIRSRLDSMGDGKFGNWWSGSPEFDLLLSLPKDVSRDRTIEVVAAINLVVSLIVNCTLANALSPLKTSELAPEQQLLGELLNLTVHFGTLFGLMVSLFTTYLLMHLATVSTAVTARTISWGHLLWPYQVVTYLQTLAIIVSMVLATWLNCAPSSAWGVTLSTAVLFVAGQTHFAIVQREMFPEAGLKWGSLTPWVWSDANIARARAQLPERIEEATSIYRGEGTIEQSSAAARELEALFEAAVPAMGAARRSYIVQALVQEELRVDTLRAAGAAGGVRLLFDVLEEENFDLRFGERLAIATALTT